MDAPRRIHAARYVQPLREGGSLPAIVEDDAGALFVAKWRGAGQGSAALVAELVVGMLAQAVGLPIPELALLELDDGLGRTERDQEVGALLDASLGTNFAIGFLPGAIAYDPAARVAVDPQLAARIVVFDAYAMNVDRTARNPNLLWSDGQLWLIDHGAALYWHHGWDGVVDRPDRPFPLVRDHVLLARASGLAEAGAALVAALDDATIDAAIAGVPEAWLGDVDVGARRAAYAAFLRTRRDAADAFIEEAVRARSGV